MLICLALSEMSDSHSSLSSPCISSFQPNSRHVVIEGRTSGYRLCLLFRGERCSRDADSYLWCARVGKRTHSGHFRDPGTVLRERFVIQILNMEGCDVRDIAPVP